MPQMRALTFGSPGARPAAAVSVALGLIAGGSPSQLRRCCSSSPQRRHQRLRPVGGTELLYSVFMCAFAVDSNTTSCLACRRRASLGSTPFTRTSLHLDDQRGVQAELEALASRLGLAAVDVSPGR
jgi:hypothetical protein